MNEALEHYASDRSRLGPARPGSHTGSAGGAACGDVVRISIELDPVAGLTGASWEAEGCGAARAAAAATCELLDGAGLAEAALIGAAEIDAELGGLSPVGLHAADLAADALHRALGAAALSGDPLLRPPAPGSGSRTLVAMSGGVDSAAAALLEQRGGAEVFAVTLELWSDPANDGEASCCSPQAVRLARSVAHSMGIPHFTVDLRERFREGVVDPFLAGYAAGTTPNPCVRCNGRVRLEPMIGMAERLGAEGLATGHYARITDDGGGPLLASAADPGKDQTYMLAALPPPALARMRFPLAGLRKAEVRDLAREAGLPVAGRAESQDLCFLAGEGKSRFLERHGGIGPREGDIVDRDGVVLGTHDGHHLFTVGQRKGIRLGGPEPHYVLETHAAENRVVVGAVSDLERERVDVTEPTFHRDPGAVTAVKLRYRAPALPCRVAGVAGGRAVIELDAPTRRPAPGQTAVFLRDDVIVGYATIA